MVLHYLLSKHNLLLGIQYTKLYTISSSEVQRSLDIKDGAINIENAMIWNEIDIKQQDHIYFRTLSPFFLSNMKVIVAALCLYGLAVFAGCVGLFFPCIK